ncbi:MAG: Hint domain-containing protein [Pseudooceanicola sp.]
MATYYLASWDAAEFKLISGADPFSDYNDPNYSALGTIFTVGTAELIEVHDDDTIFDETDFDQEFFGSSDPDGRNASDGTNIDPEYSYTIRKVGAPSDGSEDIIIYVYEMGEGPGADGFVANAWVEPGAQYEIVAVDSAHHETAYSNIYVCFASTTRVFTPGGHRPVGTLRAGDRVWTVDRGFQPLLWTGSRRLGPGVLDGMPSAWPVRIAPGAVAPGVPVREVIVSPQHRVLVRSQVVERMFGTPEILAPAHALTVMPGIDRHLPPEGITFCHLLFDRHHVVDAEGMRAESLLPGPEALRALGARQRREVEQLLGRVAGESAVLMEPARPVIRGRRLQQALRRHLLNGKCLCHPLHDEPCARIGAA